MKHKSDFIQSLLSSYQEHGLSKSIDYSQFPSMSEVENCLDSIKDLLFPGIYRPLSNKDSAEEFYVPLIANIKKQLELIIKKYYLNKDPNLNEAEVLSLTNRLIDSFFDNFVSIRELLITDAKAIYNGDPAAKSVEEVLISYVTFQAILTYRIAHFFYKKGLFLFARMMAEIAHFNTSIDIHPGAKIAASFCIDHGTGVVIGETAVIGENVKLYQGVTLGAFSVDKSDQDKKRHPTIEDNVTIYAMSTILGGTTVVGANSVIGANVWLTKSVPSGSKIKLSTIS